MPASTASGTADASGAAISTTSSSVSACTMPATGLVAPARTLVTVRAIVPVAGILLFVAWNMGEWHEFARLRNFSTQYRTILVGTFALTVVFDLTVAVEVGLVLACVFFIYRMSTLFKVLPHLARPGRALPEGVQVFELYGSLFFGAVGGIERLETLLQPGTRTLVLEMNRLVLIDASGIDALQQLHRLLKRRGVVLVLASVNEQPLSLIRRSGFEAALGAAHIVANLDDVETPARQSADA